MSRPVSAVTRAIHQGLGTDRAFGAVVPPLVLSSNFTFEGPGRSRQYDYTRSGNPTRDLLGEALADLEGGAQATITSSGMSAITTVLQSVAPGGRVLAPVDCYGGTWRLLDALQGRGALQVEWVDFTRDQEWQAALARPVDLVWIETPTNPLLRLTDLIAVSRAAHAAGGTVVVDNTFLSPLGQRPLDLGADVVIHSTTKYLNGHSDVVGGAVVCKHRERGDELRWWANCLGVTGAPFDSYLTLRGVRTLAARMDVHERNAQRLARFLADSSAVARVHYPGLPDHPQHALACRQQLRFGAMISLELPAVEGVVEAFLDGLECFFLAESLGGVESLVAHPTTMTHAAMSADARQAAGITDTLLRLSVGIEDGDDLQADLERALARVRRLGARTGCARVPGREPPIPSPASRGTATA